MSNGHTLIVGTYREPIHRVVNAAPRGSVITIKPPRRSIDQNAKMWAMLTDISIAQPEGRSLTPDVWKSLFLHALDHAQRFEMALDGKGMVPVGFRSSRLSKTQMADLITLIEEYGARHNVKWSNEE